MMTRAFLQRYWRHFSVVAVLAIFLGGGIFIFATLPPRTIVMATGPKGEANYEVGARYREILAKSGVTLQLRPTSGGMENLQLLGDSKSGVDAALVQGGVSSKADFPDVESLGTISYEPLWLFYRGEIGANLSALAGRRLSIGPEGSGSRALALDILTKTKVKDIIGEILTLAPEVASEKLTAGEIDAAFVVSSWDSPIVQTLLNAKGIQVASFARADAFVALFPFLNKLTLPAGVVDLVANRPPADVVLLAPKASLAVRGELHSAAQYLLLTASQTIYSRPGIFQKAGQFPAAESIDFPLSDEAQRFYKSGRPFLQQYLPFWLATLLERAIVVLVPLIALIYPIFKLVPILYDWFMQSKIEKLYAQMRTVEGARDSNLDEASVEASNRELDLLELQASRLPLPAAYDSSLYTLRSHIALIRERFESARPKDTT